jgi:hypothetical protein
MQAHPTRRRAIICGRGAQPASSLRHVGGAPRTQGEPGHKKAVAERSHFGDLESQNVSRARRRSEKCFYFSAS